MSSASSAKIKSRAELVAIVKQLQADGKRVGYTSGVFDLLHPGHVDYLEQARTRCDCLVVGVNSDSSVRQNKGDSRPIVSETDRLAVVVGLSSVDYAFVFEDLNNNDNISSLKPDLYLKAGDYDLSQLSSAPIVEQYGGKVELVPMQSGYSTSAIIDDVVNSFDLARTSSLSIEPYARCPAVFVDRDGTINKNVDYLHEPEKLSCFLEL